MNKKITLSNKFNLFLLLLRDFQNYKIHKKEKDSLLPITPIMRGVLEEIIQSQIFTVFLINNEAIKYELRKRLQKEKEQKMLEAKKQKSEEEDEDYESNLKLIQFKRAKNTSCFGQRSIGVYKHYYHSLNEMLIAKNDICDLMFTIIHDSFTMSIEMEGSVRNDEDKFVLMNPKTLLSMSNTFNSTISNQNATYCSELSSNRMNYTIKKFASVNEYNKYFKSNTTTRALTAEPTQYQMFLDTMNRKKYYGKQKNFPQLATHGKGDKEENEKGENVKKKNKTGLELPSIMELNKDIRYQIEKKVKKIKKHNIPHEKRETVCYKEFNYNNIFLMNNKSQKFSKY